MLARSNFRNQMLPTIVRPEVLPTSTSMRKTSETRKQKEVKRAKKRRVRVACLIFVFEGGWLDGRAPSEGEVREVLDGGDFWRRARGMLGRAMVVERRVQTDNDNTSKSKSIGHRMKPSSALPMALSWWGETEGALKEERKTKATLRR